MRLTEAEDAYGRAMLDGHLGKDTCEIVERDDGYVGLSSGPPVYLAPYHEWSTLDKKAIRLAKGRVLDVGCGAGRVGIHLASKGLETIGIDISPLAVETCHRRGFKDAHVCPFEQVSRRRFGRFDTVVMLGNNFGLMAGAKRARIRLKRLASMTTDRVRIIAQSMAPEPPEGADCPEEHLAYHRHNRERDRLPGQLRIRVRYRTLKTPYFDYLLASREEMAAILEGTGWRISRIIDGKGIGPYVAVIVRK